MVDRETHSTPARVRLEAPGIGVLVGTFLGAFIEAALLFAAAGRLDLPRASGGFVLSYCLSLPTGARMVPTSTALCALAAYRATTARTD